jgi:hypothetical protein
MKRGGIVHTHLRSVDGRLAAPQTYEEPHSMSWWQYIMRVEILPLMIPIVAIVVGGIIGIVTILIRHRERMAMIERGLNPDYPAEEDDADQDPAARSGNSAQTAVYVNKDGS